jgi:hypothetical protein
VIGKAPVFPELFINSAPPAQADSPLLSAITQEVLERTTEFAPSQSTKKPVV